MKQLALAGLVLGIGYGSALACEELTLASEEPVVTTPQAKPAQAPIVIAGPCAGGSCGNPKEERVEPAMPQGCPDRVPCARPEAVRVLACGNGDGCR